MNRQTKEYKVQLEKDRINTVKEDIDKKVKSIEM